MGRNYAKHAAEMNSDVPDEPVIFLKPRSSLIFNGDEIKLPTSSKEVHHEVEMVLLIGKEAKNLPPKNADVIISACCVGLDITARDLQSVAKKSGLPWSLAKGFDTFAPIGTWAPVNNDLNLDNLDIFVEVNGETRQHGNTSDMIFPVNQIISYLSNRFTLYPGDLIFTGTPEGVSQILSGDYISATLGNGLSSLSTHVSD